MFKSLCLSLFITISSISNAQINHTDSTVNVIAYWIKGDSDIYNISHEKYSVKDGDTSKTELISYDAVFSILDSTADGYSCSWKTINMKSDNENALANTIIKQSDNLTLIFKANTYGTFLEVSNWEEIKRKIDQSFDALMKQFTNKPDELKRAAPMIDKFRRTYSTKEGIETFAIDEIRIMLSFYGYAFKLGEEIEDSVKIPNAFSSIPYDASVLVYLDEIDSVNNNYTIVRKQTVDSKQLASTVKEFMAASAGNNPEEKEKIMNLKNFSNEMQLGSIIHNSGWLLNGWNIKKVRLDNVETVESIFIDISH